MKIESNRLDIEAQHVLEDVARTIREAPEDAQLTILASAAMTMRPYIDAGDIEPTVVWDRLQNDAVGLGIVIRDGQDAVQAAFNGYVAVGALKDTPDIDLNNKLDEIALEHDALSAVSALPAALNKHREAITGTWEEPNWSILDDRRGDLPKFPTDVFSTPWQWWLRRAARGAGVTEAHVAVPFLGIASSLIGSARLVRASSSWSEPCTTWTAGVGFSGTGKTPGIDVTKKALSKIEADRKPKVAELQSQHESRAQIAKAANKKWMADVEAAIEGGSAPPAIPAAARLLGPFTAPRLYLTSVTIERLPSLFEARPSGALLIVDELAGLFLNTKRYSGGQDDEFWLEAWNGSSHVVERVGRPAVRVDRLLIGITGGFQPDKLAQSFAGGADGMYARICFSWPDEPGYKPLTNDVAEIEPEIINALNRIIDLPAEIDGTFKPSYLSLSADARCEFEEFRQQIDSEKSGLFGREREWFAKAQAHVVRLAGTLAILDWAIIGGVEPKQIELDVMQSAVRLVRDYFWPHSRAAIRQIGLSERNVNARRVLLWVKAHQKSEVSIEDVRRIALNQRLDAGQTQALLDGLELAGWLRKTTTPTAGRFRHRWDVNPRLFGAAESAQSAESPAAPEVSRPTRAAA
jgi:hypothetical protein